jgi:hypothetical protein
MFEKHLKPEVEVVSKYPLLFGGYHQLLYTQSFHSLA